MLEMQMGQIWLRWLQAWRWLQQMGQRLIATVMSWWMPVGLMLAFAAQVNQPDPDKGVVSQNQAATLTYWTLPERSYRRVPRVEEGSRRGITTDWRQGSEMPLELEIEQTAIDRGTVLMPTLGWQMQPSAPRWQYQTLLPTTGFVNLD